MNEVKFAEKVGADMKSAETRLATLETIKEYVLTINPQTASQERMGAPENRRKLFVQGGFGKLHIDFIYVGENKAGGQILFNFPEGTPRPNGLIEVQAFDGAAIWAGHNQTVVRGGGLTTGQRYIVDLVGFWLV